MKFIGINDAYKSNKSNVTSLIATIGICVFCALTGIGVKTMIDMGSQSDIKAHESEVAELLEEAETSVTSESTAETSETSESLMSASVRESVQETEITTSETSITETTAVETTTLTSEVTETTVKRDAAHTDTTSSKSKKKETSKKKAEPTKAPTATPKPKNSISETKVSLRVYASGTVNLRSKPDKDSALVRTLDDGDAIDVVAKTSNGWYKTFNGNYVLASLTTEDKPAAATETTAASSKATTTAAGETTKTTTKATESTKATTAESSSAGAEKKGMTFLGKYTVTFYGPQKLKDGTYSHGTASGKTCTEGRTIAADPSIPFGTVIYVENDPLGGDGYYTVEDRGPGVTGNEIDIFAEDGESGRYNTTTRNVYIVNK